MKRNWKDPRHGKTWQVRVSDPPGIPVSKGLKLGEPLPPDHILFTGDIDGETVQIGVTVSAFLDPNEQNEIELQWCLDQALEKYREERGLDAKMGQDPD